MNLGMNNENTILILQRFNNKCNDIYKKLPEITYEKNIINYYSINSFIKSEKCDNDKNNKIREYIIGAIINGKIPVVYYKYSSRWNSMRENVNNYIEMLLKDKNILEINKIICIHKGGRNNSYDFKIVINDFDFNVELKFNISNVVDSPQFVSPMKPSQYLSNSYEEYYYDNYLTELSKSSNLKIPDRIEYLNTIHNTEPLCLEKYIEKYYGGCKGSSRYTQHQDDIRFYEDAKKYSKESIQNFIEMTELNIEKLSSYLKNTQKDKFYMMYENNKFSLEKINTDNYEITSYTKTPNKALYIATTKMGNKLNILLRWKNGNGIAFPAFQIKYIECTKIKPNKPNNKIKPNKTNNKIKPNKQNNINKYTNNILETTEIIETIETTNEYKINDENTAIYEKNENKKASNINDTNVIYYLILKKDGNTENNFYEISLNSNCVIMRFGKENNDKFITLTNCFDNKSEMDKYINTLLDKRTKDGYKNVVYK
jgi:predicted DNA-binding WGR domain protein